MAMTGTKKKPAKPNPGRPIARRKNPAAILTSPSFRGARKRAADRRRRKAEAKHRAEGNVDG
jgi:hypothetical protein